MLPLSARTGVLRGIGSMGAAVTHMVLGSSTDTPAQEKVTLADVVKQATSAKKKDAEEDVLVMDTKLKIIEILQVMELIN